jgi:hypothetical protein
VNAEQISAPTLVSEWIVNSSRNAEFYIFPDGDTTVVKHVALGREYVIRNGGRPVSISPDGMHLLWQVFDREGEFDLRHSQTWLANIDGSQARIVGETIGFGESRWIDDHRLLLVGLPLEPRTLVSISVLELESDQGDADVRSLAQVNHPRGTLLSPAGEWLVYYLAFQSDPQDDGLWIVPTDGHSVPLKLDFFGSYRWRDDQRLLFVPLNSESDSHVFWEYDVLDHTSQPLTNPAQTAFRITNNDWVVSPDGQHIVFVNAADHNLWLIDLVE